MGISVFSCTLHYSTGASEDVRRHSSLPYATSVCYYLRKMPKEKTPYNLYPLQNSKSYADFDFFFILRCINIFLREMKDNFAHESHKLTRLIIVYLLRQ